MIYTLTANPSIDRTVITSQIRFNEELHCENAETSWGGKGVLVSRALKKIGDTSTALAWVGGTNGEALERGLNGLGINTDFIWVENDTRINTHIQEEDSEWYLRINERGPKIAPENIKAMVDKITQKANEGDYWVVSGSLPPGVPKDFYRDLIAILNDKDCKVFFEASGEAFDQGKLETPYLIMPTVKDAQKILGSPIKSADDIKRVAISFLRGGVDYFVFSLENNQVVLASQEEIVLANIAGPLVSRPFGVHAAVMAGVVHGFINNLTLQETSRWAVAYGYTVNRIGQLNKISQTDVEASLQNAEVRIFNVM